MRVLLLSARRRAAFTVGDASISVQLMPLVLYHQLPFCLSSAVTAIPVIASVLASVTFLPIPTIAEIRVPTSPVGAPPSSSTKPSETFVSLSTGAEFSDEPRRFIDL